MDTIRKLSELAVGQTAFITLMLTRAETAISKRNEPYARLTVTDGVKEAVLLWFDGAAEDFPYGKGDLVGFTLTGQLYNGELSYKITGKGAPEAGRNTSEFIPSPPWQAEALYDRILKILEKEIPAHTDGTNSLADLVRAVYESDRDKLLKSSAAKSVHHNMRGGLLYHTFCMVSHGFFMKQVYPLAVHPISDEMLKTLMSQGWPDSRELYGDKEVLLAALALHDIGKLDEMDTDELGTAEYTVDGNLYTHSILGLQRIERVIAEKQLKLDPEKYRILRHCILAHHGKPEWGATTYPKTLEAELLFLIDYMDARAFGFRKFLSETEPGQMGKVFGLEGQLYHPVYEGKAGYPPAPGTGGDF